MLVNSCSGMNEAQSSIQWGSTNRKAHGISLSLYDKNPINGKMSGKYLVVSVTHYIDDFVIVSTLEGAVLLLQYNQGPHLH